MLLLLMYMLVVLMVLLLYLLVRLRPLLLGRDIAERVEYSRHSGNCRGGVVCCGWSKEGG